MKKIIALIALIIIIIILLFIGCSKKETGEQIIFKDKQFEKMIKAELKKETIFKEDLSEISGIMIASDKVLGLSGGGHKDKSVILFGFDSFEYENVRYKEFGTIKTLEDLKNFPKLTSLRVYLQPNIDFETIPNRGNIYNLGLSQNKIDNLGFLEGYNKLMYLTLSSNSIKDLKGLDGAKTVKRLSFNSNKVEDISLLSDFKNLEYLDLTYNKVTNIEPIRNLEKLNYLSLYENGIINIEPLKDIKTLTKLYLNNNKITDISPLKEFKNFEALNITNNPITNYEEIDHIQGVVK